ncbi:hypothetical protein ACFQUU_27425 [Herbaspirillum sp. GCM10030257]|uniref:hypothetical protein n=1 Tax=Herbaspirillum sp. GCM10030257 TaxID=3273393 RepID=UPI003623A288
MEAFPWFMETMMLVGAILASSSIKSRQLAKWYSLRFIPKVAIQVVVALLTK